MQILNSIQHLKWRLAFLLCFITYLQAPAQNIENVGIAFDQRRQLVLIHYDLKRLNYKKEIQIIPYIILSNDSLQIMKSLSGDFGWMVHGGRKKLLTWDAIRDEVDNYIDVQYNIKTEVRDAKIPRFWGIELQGSNSAPFGLKGMRLSDFGFFAGFRVGKLPPSYRYTITNAGEMNYLESGVYEIGTEKRLASYAITAGPIFQVARNVYGYAGLGYGLEQLFWKYQAYNLDKTPISSDWALNENINQKGVATDVGVVVRLGPVLLDLGLSAIQFKTFQITGGLGLSLPKNLKFWMR